MKLVLGSFLTLSLALCAGIAFVGDLPRWLPEVIGPIFGGSK